MKGSRPLRFARCICGRDYEREFTSLMLWCSFCQIKISALDFMAGVDPRSLEIQTIRSWWRAQGVEL